MTTTGTTTKTADATITTAISATVTATTTSSEKPTRTTTVATTIRTTAASTVTTTRATKTARTTTTTELKPGKGGEEVPDGYVSIGRILGPWGVRGDVKVDPLADSGRFRPGLAVTVAGGAHTVDRVNASSGRLHLKLSGIDDRDTAAGLRGQHLLVPEADLGPAGEDRYYRFQLIGLAVVTTAGDQIGEITDVFGTGSNDVFVVKGPRGEILVPAIEDVVQEINLESRRVTIDPIPGLLPD
jgi:16S rRNA processing protein RimM